MKTKKKKVTSVMMPEGAGARIRRLFPTSSYQHIDPFVLLDEFFVGPHAGFPMHPHSGFEAVTYMLQGSLEYQDNLGIVSKAGAGGVQHFLAGSGFEHAEMPASEELCHGLQLWINLPTDLKNSHPTLKKAESNQLPEAEIDGVRIRTIVGDDSPLALQTAVIYQHVFLEPHYSYNVNIKAGFNGFIYVLEGSVSVLGEKMEQYESLVVQNFKQCELRSDDRTQVVVAVGHPLGQPILLRGTCVC